MTNQCNRIIKLNEVTHRTGISRSSLYKLIETGEFPKQVPIGARAVGWLESEVEGWIEQQIIKRGA